MKKLTPFLLLFLISCSKEKDNENFSDNHIRVLKRVEVVGLPGTDQVGNPANVWTIQLYFDKKIDGPLSARVQWFWVSNGQHYDESFTINSNATPISYSTHLNTSGVSDSVKLVHISCPGYQINY